MFDNKRGPWVNVGFIGIFFAIAISMFIVYLNQKQFKTINQNASFTITNNKNISRDFEKLRSTKTYTRSAESKLNSAIAEKSAEIEAVNLNSKTTKNMVNSKNNKKSSDNGMLNHLKKELQHQVNLMPHPTSN